MVADPGRPLQLVLLASPLLGPAVWAPVARELEARRWPVVLPPPYDAVTSPADVLAQVLPAIPSAAPLVLVTHSNAGRYAAAVAAERDVRGLVFVDALLPESAPTAPAGEPALRAFLDRLVEPDGLLPRWTGWWPPEEVAGLFPDHGTRAAVEAEQVRLPPGYFDAAVPAPPGWERLPAAYLAFGGTYADEVAHAESQRWPVVRLEGGHLHMLADPAGVAQALERLVGLLGTEGG